MGSKGNGNKDRKIDRFWTEIFHENDIIERLKRMEDI